MDTSLLDLPDGRTLGWSEIGDPAGYPVLIFHGTPGSRYQVLADPAPAVAAGVRLIGVDRPGYGRSTYAPQRALVDWASDIAALADHLGVDRFAVMGASGGGPHALVCAALLPDRISAAATLSGVGPMGVPGSEAGMMAANRLFARLARRLPGANLLPFGALAMAGRRMPDRILAMTLKSAPPPDAEVLARPEVSAAFRRDFVETSPTAGRAATQDFRLFAQDWGFRLEDIRVPVHVWQADADVNVPVAHALAMAAAIPGSVLHLVPDEGHFMAFVHMDEVLQQLLASDPG